ncbi:MAG: hypothetical protein V3V28_05900 [Polaribacter sp.]|uniref:hypothetical protein n=1 Tax=Polaribacter sp. TaxID=1920175 RepID=UPI002F355658
MSKYLLILFGIILLFFSSCKKDKIESNKVERTTKFDSLKKVVLIRGKEYENMVWHYDKKGNLRDDKGFNYLIQCKDTFIVNKESIALINLIVPFFKKQESKIKVCLPRYDTLDFNNGFYNEEDIEKKCFYNLETSGMQEKFDVERRHSVVFSKKFKSVGNKIIRAVLTEYLLSKKDTLGEGGALDSIHKSYIEIPVYVKDSV